MRAQLFACAVLAACVAPVGAASPPTASPAPESEKAIPGGIGTFSSRLVVLEDDLVARAYEAGLRMALADDSTAEADVSAALAHAATSMFLPYVNPRIEAGDFAGNWEFIQAKEGGLPKRAWRDIDASSIDGYAAERIGYCKDTREACMVWFEDGRNRSPQPRRSDGGRAYTEWSNRVMEEPCRLQADHRPGTSPLGAAIARSGIEKTELIMMLLLNPCGEVRDVSIVTSSGVRDVDYVAARWARGARFVSTLQKLGSLGRRGTVARIPFSLSNDP